MAGRTGDNINSVCSIATNSSCSSPPPATPVPIIPRPETPPNLNLQRGDVAGRVEGSIIADQVIDGINQGSPACGPAWPPQLPLPANTNTPSADVLQCENAASADPTSHTTSVSDSQDTRTVPATALTLNRGHRPLDASQLNPSERLVRLTILVPESWVEIPTVESSRWPNTFVNPRFLSSSGLNPFELDPSEVATFLTPRGLVRCTRAVELYYMPYDLSGEALLPHSIRLFVLNDADPDPGVALIIGKPWIEHARMNAYVLDDPFPWGTGRLTPQGHIPL